MKNEASAYLKNPRQISGAKRNGFQPEQEQVLSQKPEQEQVLSQSKSKS
jgi:hypothetical protein